MNKKIIVSISLLFILFVFFYLRRDGNNIIDNFSISYNDVVVVDIKKQVKSKKLVKEDPVKINLINVDGMSPLMDAVCRENIEDVKRLVSVGASVDVHNKEMASPLTIAVSSGNYEITKYLLDYGADPNYVFNKINYTLLMDGAMEGNLPLVTLLIDYGADVNSLDSDNMTALIYASKEGHFEVVKKLLESGADSSVQGNDGQTAYSLAKKNKFDKILAILSK